jgi:radical SAM domain protein
MPNDGKICSFDCIYCECGFNKDHRTKSPFPTLQEVASKLEDKLIAMKADNQMPDVLTFAGNGEPTANPQFAEIIDDEYINKVDRPTIPSYKASKIVEEMKAFNGKLIVQTMFLKGISQDGIDVNNVKESFIAPWLDAVKNIAPREVMIYTIARETPDPNLEKATKLELDTICERVKALGIPCSASY